MAARPKFYDPQEVTITAFGAIIQGFSTDSMIKVASLAEAFVNEVGVDGEVCRSKISDNRVKVTLSLLQSSQSNSVLSAQITLDKLGKNGAGVGSFQMVDNQGGSICRGSACWIEKWPDADWGKSAKSREWVIVIADGQRYENGN